MKSYIHPFIHLISNIELICKTVYLAS